MKFSNVRLLVRDYEKCFRFYTEKLGLETAFDIEGCYGSSLSAFPATGAMRSDVNIANPSMPSATLKLPVAGNADKELPAGCRDKMMVSFEVDNVDEAFETLSARGVEFVNRPTDIPGWGMRVVYLRDPEENLIELFTPLAANL